ncbi:MAG: flagellar biosynthetic protein FliO [Pseudomonadota bacterium]|nr:flagellar biosynthetic protein FliO [Pseudomonadota bacterium]
MDYSYLVSFVKMLFALAIVLGIMLGAVYVLKRIMRHTAPGGGAEGPIAVLATRYLGPKSSIMMLEVTGRILIVGVTANGINLLTEIDDQSAVERIRAERMSQNRLGAAALAVPGQYRAAMESVMAAIGKRRKK